MGRGCGGVRVHQGALWFRVCETRWICAPERAAQQHQVFYTVAAHPHHLPPPLSKQHKAMGARTGGGETAIKASEGLVWLKVTVAGVVYRVVAQAMMRSQKDVFGNSAPRTSNEHREPITGAVIPPQSVRW